VVSKKVKVPTALRTKFIGTKGSGVLALESECGVLIDSMRDSEQVVVTGPSDAAAGAVQRIRDFVQENEVLSEDYSLEGTYVARFLLANKAQRLTDLRGQTTARLDVQMVDGDGASRRSKVSQTMTIRGTRHALADAKVKLGAAVAEIKEQTRCIPLGSRAVLPVLLGKGGQAINKLLADFPSVAFEIGDESDLNVRLFSDDAEALASAEAVTREIVVSNQRLEIVMGAEEGKRFFGNSGKTTRDALYSELPQLSMVRDKEQDRVRLRGPIEVITRAKEVIESFMENHMAKSLPLVPEDVPALMAAEEPNLLRQLRERLMVEAQLDRKSEPPQITFSGQREAVLEACEEVRGYLNGKEDGTVILVRADPDVMGAGVGKKGSNAKRLQERYGVRLESVNSRSQFRLRGSDPVQVAAAAADLETSLEALPIAAYEVVPAEALTSGRVYPEAVRDLAQECGLISAELLSEQGNDGGVTFRGVARAVAEAKVRLRQYVAGKATQVVRLAPHQAADLPAGADLWDTLRERTAIAVRRSVKKNRLGKTSKASEAEDTQLAVDIEEDTVTLEGSVLTVREAHHELSHLLALRFPEEFFVFPASKAALSAKAGVSRTFLRNVANRCGAMLALDWHHSCVHVVGDEVSTKKARQELHARFEDYSRRYVTLPLSSENQIGRVVGAKGATIGKLEARPGVKSVKVDRGTLTVHFEGEPEAVAAAADELRAILGLEKTSQDEHEERLKMRRDAVRELLNKKGTNIRRIEKNSGARIALPKNMVKDPAGAVVVTFRGSQDAVDKAIALIRQLFVDKARSTAGLVQRSLGLGDDRQAGRFAAAIIGRGGETVRQISDESKAQVTVTPASEGWRKVTVSGSAAAVEAAEEGIRAVLVKAGFDEGALQFSQDEAEHAADPANPFVDDEDVTANDGGGAKRAGGDKSGAKNTAQGPPQPHSAPIGAPDHPKAQRLSQGEAQSSVDQGEFVVEIGAGDMAGLGDAVHHTVAPAAVDGGGAEDEGEDEPRGFAVPLEILVDEEDEATDQEDSDGPMARATSVPPGLSETPEGDEQCLGMEDSILTEFGDDAGKKLMDMLLDSEVPQGPTPPPGIPLPNSQGGATALKPTTGDNSSTITPANGQASQSRTPPFAAASSEAPPAQAARGDSGGLLSGTTDDLFNMLMGGPLPVPGSTAGPKATARSLPVQGTLPQPARSNNGAGRASEANGHSASSSSSYTSKSGFKVRW